MCTIEFLRICEGFSNSNEFKNRLSCGFKCVRLNSYVFGKVSRIQMNSIFVVLVSCRQPADDIMDHQASHVVRRRSHKKCLMSPIMIPLFHSSALALQHRLSIVEWWMKVLMHPFFLSLKPIQIEDVHEKKCGLNSNDGRRREKAANITTTTTTYSYHRSTRIRHRRRSQPDFTLPPTIKKFACHVFLLASM